LSELAFATSNAHKFREAAHILQQFGIRLKRLASKGAEVQSDDVSEIARFAAARCSREYGRSVLVEDTGLFVDSLNGFPGTYASFVCRTLGPSSLLKLLGGKDRRATFVSSVAYCEPSGEPVVFTGRLSGRIVRPRGHGGFGFDAVFVPAGLDRTLAELSFREKCAVSHRAIAFRTFASWFTETNGQRLSAQL
jgi:XTP/dITP diphosphohydrolase